MPEFTWYGVNKKGRRVNGKIDAETLKQAKILLRRDGIRPTKVEAPKFYQKDLGQMMADVGLVKPFGVTELTHFTKQMAILFNAGVPITDSLDILGRQEKNISLRTSIRSISRDVSDGKTLYESMRRQNGFSKFYCSLIKAGEAAGILDNILNKLADYLERQDKLAKKVKGAMMYPAFVSIIGIGVIMALMIFVVPAFVDMLKAGNQEVPGVTQAVIDLSNFIQTNFIYIFLGMVVFAIGLMQFKKNPQTKPFWDQFMLHAPLFGDLTIKSDVANFTRTLSTMLTSGVSIIDSIEICLQTLQNTVIIKDVAKAKGAIVKGKNFSDPIQKIKYFPPMVQQMIKVGESTGNLDSMLGKIADVYEDEVYNTVDNLTKLIEPIMIVVLGGMVAFVLVAMYMPIFKSAGGFG